MVGCYKAATGTGAPGQTASQGVQMTDFSIMSLTGSEFQFLFYEFPYIVKSMSISDAARELHTTQTTLSKRMASIEKKYGVTLIDRRQGIIQLSSVTPAGEAVLKASVEVADSCNRMIEELDRLRRNPARVVAFSVSIEPSFFETIRQMKEKLKASDSPVRLKYCKPGFRPSFDLLRDGDIDLLFEPHSPMADEHGLESIPLFHEPAAIAVNPQSPLAGKPEVGIDDIRDLTFASIAENSAYSGRKHLHSVATAHGFVPRFAIRPLASLSALLMDGLDADEAIFMPYSYRETIHSMDPDVTVIELTDSSCDYDMRAFYRAGDKDKAVATVVDLLRGASEERGL